jgi:Tol biopolymer transport system component
MSSVDWVPELAAALRRVVPLEDSSRADWDDVVARAGKRRSLRQGHGRPRWSLRLAIVVALLLLLLAGVATATYLIVRGNGGIAVGGGRKLVVVNPNTGRTHAITSCGQKSRRRGCGIEEPAFSPNGKRVAFLRGFYYGGAGQVPSHLSLYVAATNGAGARRLAPCGICGLQYQGQHLGWSPNGKWIAFSSDAGPIPAFQSLWVVAAAGGKPRRLTNCHASCSDIEPTWSPNGQLLAFEHYGHSRSGLYTIRPDGSHLIKISSTYGEPQWSPNGRRIAFDYGQNSIAVANADGSHLHVLLKGARGTGPGTPSWSPDSRQLVFATTPRLPRGYPYAVWTMNADGSGKQRLYQSACCVEEYAAPIWSPNGQQIAFSFFIGKPADGTYEINTDGTGLKRLSTIATDQLSWQHLPRGNRK